MFRMSSLSPADEFKGTIRVAKPITSLGQVTDLDGQRWDIGAIYRGGVSACKREALHSYFTDTSYGCGTNGGTTGTMGSGIVSQRWDAYQVEVVAA